jgi:hypothetical protein
LEIFHVEFDGTSFSRKEFKEVRIEADPASQNESEPENDKENKEDLPVMMETKIGNPFKQPLSHDH